MDFIINRQNKYSIYQDQTLKIDLPTIIGTQNAPSTIIMTTDLTLLHLTGILQV